MRNLLKSKPVPLTLKEQIERARRWWERMQQHWGDDSALTRDARERLMVLMAKRQENAQ